MAGLRDVHARLPSGCTIVWVNPGRVTARCGEDEESIVIYDERIDSSDAHSHRVSSRTATPYLDFKALNAPSPTDSPTRYESTQFVPTPHVFTRWPAGFGSPAAASDFTCAPRFGPGSLARPVLRPPPLYDHSYHAPLHAPWTPSQLGYVAEPGAVHMQHSFAVLRHPPAQ